ncbi:MAG: DUF1761 domain-containing protein [Rhodospirillaceae bacterium]|nr:DUF1761 domain-containing protein [Rhodospirillaceae bacterium]
MFDINWLAVPVAALAVFVVGGPWYGPLFGKAWHAASKMQPTTATQHPGKVFALAYVFGLIGAVAIAVVLGPAPTLSGGFMTGAGVGVVAAAAFGINYQFAGHSAVWLAIDAVYTIILCAVMGATIGVFG